MTAVRDSWLRQQARKRDLVSWVLALAAYLLAFLVLTLLSTMTVEELSDYSGPIIVRLGSPDGLADPPPVPEPAVTPAVPQTQSVPVPEPAVAPEPAKPAAVPKPVAAPKPVATPPVDATPTTATTPPVPAAPVPVVIKGSESGNSYDMSINAGSGRIGRSLYVPIVLFMPLPFDVPAELYTAIPDLAGLPGTADNRKAAFAKFYEKKTNGAWQLKRLRQPEYDFRPELWTMLEDAGYDVKNAEYKADKHLRSVEILFKVSAPAGGGTPKLEDVLMESSSGYSDIDAAVLYGFRKAEFSNSGSDSVSGRFTYRF